MTGVSPPAGAVTYPVMGVPVEFRTDPEIAPAVERCFGFWAGLSERDVSPDAAGRVTLRYREGMEAAVMGEVTYDVQSARALSLRIGGSSGWVDAERRQAEATITSSLLDQTELLEAGVLHALALVLVTARGRRPLHAALIERDGIGVLLAGPSGSGKSSLAYAAGRHGWTVRADDSVFLDTEPDPGVWTSRFGVRLAPSAAMFFPELASAPTEWTARGKERIVVRDVTTGPAPFRGLLKVCWLGEPGDPATATPLSPPAAEDLLTGRLDPGFDLDPTAAAGVARQVARAGGWRLARGEHPMARLAALEAALGEADRREAG